MCSIEVPYGTVKKGDILKEILESAVGDKRWGIGDADGNSRRRQQTGDSRLDEEKTRGTRERIMITIGQLLNLRSKPENSIPTG